MVKPRDKAHDSPRQGRSRSAGELIGAASGPAFKRFGFVQGAVVSRWSEIVGERYAKVSSPESIRFSGGSRKNGTLTLLVEGAHAPLMQHLGPMVIERVNRFFGYEAVARLVFRQGRLPQKPQSPARPIPAPVPAELGEGLRAIADPELRACLESLAGQIAATSGPPALEPTEPDPLPIPKIRSIT